MHQSQLIDSDYIYIENGIWNDSETSSEHSAKESYFN